MTTEIVKKPIPSDNNIIFSADTLVQACHGNSYNAGWWIKTEEMQRIAPMIKAQFPQFDVEYLNLLMDTSRLMLQVSEISEAFEGARKDLMDDHLPNRKMMAAELADTVIRIFDMCGGKNIPIGEVIAEKLEYNRNRADHKLENRAKEGGKKL